MFDSKPTILLQLPSLQFSTLWFNYRSFQIKCAWWLNHVCLQNDTFVCNNRINLILFFICWYGQVTKIIEEMVLFLLDLHKQIKCG